MKNYLVRIKQKDGTIKNSEFKAVSVRRIRKNIIGIKLDQEEVAHILGEEQEIIFITDIN